MLTRVRKTKYIANAMKSGTQSISSSLISNMIFENIIGNQDPTSTQDPMSTQDPHEDPGP